MSLSERTPVNAMVSTEEQELGRWETDDVRKVTRLRSRNKLSQPEQLPRLKMQ